MSSAILKAPSVAPLFDELRRNPTSRASIAYYYWRQAAIFGDGDEALRTMPPSRRPAYAVSGSMICATPFLHS
jgi:hypothetical protein